MGFNKLVKNAGIVLTAIALFGCSQSGDAEQGIKLKQATSSDPTLAAKVDGDKITNDDLNKNMEVFQAQLGVYEAKKKVIEEMARKKALEKVASKKKMTVDEYLKSEMANSKKAVSDSKLNAFLKKMGAPENLPADRKEDARTYVHMQDVIAQATKNANVEIYFPRPKAPKLEVSSEGDATWGKKDAPVTIVEFSDFQCPFCSRATETVTQLKKQYGSNKIHIIFKQFPLPMHQNARPAAEASLCVNEQGQDKFWKFHDLAFSNQQKLSADDLAKYAKQAGVDAKKFEDCFKSKKYASHVEQDMAEGQKLGVDSTPSFFVNGQPIRGARPIADFKEVIDQELSTN